MLGDDTGPPTRDDHSKFTTEYDAGKIFKGDPFSVIEPNSVEFSYQVGMDYVSRSLYRVPIARLAAAQAAIAKTEGASEANRTA